MNWKQSLAACVAAALTLVPANVFSCADGDGDPKDYFVSFFSRESPDADRSLRPFNYSMIREFYDANDEDSALLTNQALIGEWSRYCGGAPAADAERLVLKSTTVEIQALRDGLSNGRLAPAFTGNAAAAHLLRTANKAAAEYLLFAKRSEALLATESDWEAPKIDAAAVKGMLATAIRSEAAAGDAFLKSKWAYQACRAAFYAKQYVACARLYDSYFKIESGAAVQPLALGYKAGSLFRLKRNKEAAFYFSRAFATSAFNRRSNYHGFMWSTNHADTALRPGVLALARTPQEQAGVIALFGMYGARPAQRELQQVARLDPASPSVRLLAAREIAKVEEQFPSPVMGDEPVRLEKNPVQTGNYIKAKEVRSLAQLLQRFSRELPAKDRAYYATGAGYLFLIDQQYDSSRTLLAAAEALSPSPAQRDQIRMLHLLIAANEPKALGAKEEAALLPAVKWLFEKAQTTVEYRPMLRDFFSAVLARRYSKDPVRTALVTGVAEIRFLPSGYYGSWYDAGLSQVRDKLNARQAQQLYELMRHPQTDWERLLVEYAAFDHNQVVEAIGTAYIRESNYPKAIEWLQKADSLPKMQGSILDKDNNDIPVNSDPFHDYLNDWQRYEKRVAKPYTKLTFAQKLVELQQKIDTATQPAAKAQLVYRMASAHYNMSQYGNAWMVTSWDRSGSDWNEGNYKTNWKREFFGVYKARDLYTQAYKLATDREFKAACYFMMAKCAQKQIVKPGWTANMNYQTMEALEKKFYARFQNNELFPGFVKEFGDTKFYKYTYNRCSYLRDFVRKGAQQPVKK